MTGLATRLEWLDETSSTNSLARERAEAGERGPLWIAARRQIAGRGRRGRAWSGLDGNLFATGLYTLSDDPQRAAQLSFVAALAVGDLCDAAGVAFERTRLKWPNDVLIDGRKLAGILLESGKAPGGGLWLAVGIGVNITVAPENVERPATSLAGLRAEMTRERALDILARAFDTYFAFWFRDGFGPIRDRWLVRAFGLGETCQARLNDETVTGIFADLGPDGSLRLDLARGERRFISAGEVFFPDA